MTAIETAPPIDPVALEEFVGLAASHATAAIHAVLVAVGDELGLWQSMSEVGSLTADDLARRTDVDPRLTREWLSAEAANGFVTYDAESDAFTLSPEAALVLADDNNPASMIAAFQGAPVLGRFMPNLVHAFRNRDGLAWHEHNEEFFDLQERFSRPLHLTFLIDSWLAGVPGLVERLERGASVAEVGCGYGTATILLAERFPNSRFVAFDGHDHSIARARQEARNAGVADRLSFEVADAAAFGGDEYDLVLFTDCLHDLGNPVAAARHARSTLAAGGVLVTLDPAAEDSLAANLENPMAALMYAVSTCICTPTALSQHGTHSLGAMAGSAAISQVLSEAGFTDVQRVAPEAAFNMVHVARS